MAVLQNLRYRMDCVVLERALDPKRLEAVADSKDRLDILIAVGSELFAKAADVHV